MASSRALREIPCDTAVIPCGPKVDIVSETNPITTNSSTCRWVAWRDVMGSRHTFEARWIKVSDARFRNALNRRKGELA
jgi:hypothetical protein